MYDRDDVELFLLALDEGMSVAQAGRLAGVGRSTARNWAAGRLPHSYAGKRRGRATMSAGRAESGRAPVRDERTYDPPASGPLAGLTPDQIENLLLRAVLADLKAGGWDPASISNRSKCELGERLRRETGLPLRSITAFLRISKSSYEYHRRRLALPERRPELRPRIRELFAEGGGNWGYRTIWARLRAEGVRVSEKVVRRVMREEGLEVVYNRRRRRGYSSYEGESSKAPANLVARDFSASAPDELWLTDVTEFKLPSGAKAYLSPVVDCFDGKPVAWRIGPRPDKALVNGSLLDAVARMRPGAAPVVHSDRGGHYRWPEWVSICEANGLTRSMSAKACCADNSACEGFFGRLKNEFFYHRDWRGVGLPEFARRLDSYLEYYCEGRIKRSLGWMSPNDYRRKHGYAV